MPDTTWPAEVKGSLQASHHELLVAESQSEIETLGKRLANLPVRPEEPHRERIGEAVIRAVGAERRREVVSGAIGGLDPSALVHCQTLDRPVFAIASQQAESSTIVSRADAAAGTMEVSARAGALNGRRYPTADGTAFIMAFNRATASIGAPIAIPPRGSGPALPLPRVLRVGVELQIENIWSSAPVAPGTAENLIWTVKGDGDLPLRGNAVAWCRAGLTIVGAGGSASRMSTEFVSGWANRDGMDLNNRAPGGMVRLSHTVAISAELVIAGVFVDITCFAAAEESPANVDDSAYAELKCARGDGWPVPSHLRLVPEETRVFLCEMPFIAR
jgi:hypothetical protein